VGRVRPQRRREHRRLPVAGRQQHPSVSREAQVMTETWPLPDVEFTLDVRRTALVVVDMQYYDADRRSGIGKNLEAARPGYTRYYFDRIEATVVPAIRRLLGFFRERGLPVVFLTYASETEDGRDLNPLLRARNDQRRKAIGVPSVFPKSPPDARILDPL